MTSDDIAAARVDLNKRLAEAIGAEKAAKAKLDDAGKRKAAGERFDIHPFWLSYASAKSTREDLEIQLHRFAGSASLAGIRSTMSPRGTASNDGKELTIAGSKTQGELANRTLGKVDGARRS